MTSTRWLFWTCLAITFTLCISLFCFSSVARHVPINYICLSLFTMCSSYMLASICIFQSPEVVLIAGILTMTVFFALTVFTLFTRNDLTVLSGLSVILCHVLIVMIPLFIVFHNRYVFILLCILVIVFISIFIIYDTQMIAGGKKYGLEYDDYIIGALLLYTVRKYGEKLFLIGRCHLVFVDTRTFSRIEARLNFIYTLS